MSSNQEFLARRGIVLVKYRRDCHWAEGCGLSFRSDRHDPSMSQQCESGNMLPSRISASLR